MLLWAWIPKAHSHAASTPDTSSGVLTRPAVEPSCHFHIQAHLSSPGPWGASIPWFYPIIPLHGLCICLRYIFVCFHKILTSASTAYPRVTPMVQLQRSLTSQSSNCLNKLLFKAIRYPSSVHLRILSSPSAKSHYALRLTAFFLDGHTTDSLPRKTGLTATSLPLTSSLAT